MRRAGFTMIELIFVIVILGILASVALPKFIGVSEQANAGKCSSFYGTLNRTVGPSIWSNMLTNNIPVDTAFTDATIAAQIDIPANNECGTPAEITAGAVAGTDYTVTLSGTTYDVNATGASLTSAPIWVWAKH